jgi:hemoglobin-like flavoprotein
MTSPDDRDLIEASLEHAAERAGDLTPLVYARLFAERPDVEPLFWRDKNGSIRGEMLAKVFEIVLDFVGERRFAQHLVRTSALIHTEYDVPDDLFRTFFTTVAATVRDVTGDAWTPATASAWERMLEELDDCVSGANRESAPATT